MQVAFQPRVFPPPASPKNHPHNHREIKALETPLNEIGAAGSGNNPFKNRMLNYWSFRRGNTPHPLPGKSGAFACFCGTPRYNIRITFPLNLQGGLP
jgi:hypothetical protein